MEKCVEVVSLAQVAADKGNKNAVSDAGVAALMGRAGAHAAKLNVMINLGWIDAPEHEGFVERAGRAIEDLAAEADRAADAVLSAVVAKL
jgi:formiminotetrahydrofolate cyclodeaminase